MNLDDPQQLATLDCDAMLGHLSAFPDQLSAAWERGRQLPLPDAWQAVKRVLFCGMGGSVMPGDLLQNLCHAHSPIQITTYRGYELPAWAQGDDLLVIASSHSGNTAETLAVYQQAAERGLKTLVLTSGGDLASQLHPASVLWQYSYQAPVRAVLGWQLGLCLALAARLGWLKVDLSPALETVYQFRELYRFENPAATNPAKRQAGQFMERLPVFFGGGILAAVAYRWKTLLNETAKSWAGYETLPEAAHNTVMGIQLPLFLMPKVLGMFLRSADYEAPRLAKQQNLMLQLFLEEGIGTDTFWAQGSSPLAQVLHALHYSDMVSFYAALGAGQNPSTTETIEAIKYYLSEASA